MDDILLREEAHRLLDYDQSYRDGAHRNFYRPLNGYERAFLDRLIRTCRPWTQKQAAYLATVAEGRFMRRRVAS